MKNIVFVIIILGLTVLFVKVDHFNTGFDAETTYLTGIMLLSAFLIAEIVKKIKLPKLTGYMIAGIIIGPAMLDLLSVEVMEQLHFLENMALALIALIAGGEFIYFKFVKYKHIILMLLLFQMILVFSGILFLFYFISQIVPELQSLNRNVIIGFSVLVASTSLSTSPAVTMGIISEINAKGKNTDIILMTTVLKAVILVIIFPAILAYSKIYLIPGTELNLNLVLNVGKIIIGSVVTGIILGVVTIGYLKYIGRETSLFLLGITVVIIEMSGLLGVEILLTSIVSGMVVQNLSKDGHSLIDGIETFSLPLYVTFFCFAGASLNIKLIPLMFSVTMVLLIARMVLLYLSNNITAVIVKEDHFNKHFSWMGYVGQAGIAVGLGIIIEKSFNSEIGEIFLAILLPVVIINEFLGPIKLKYILNKAKESNL